MFELTQGDCLEVLKTLADNSIDAVVTDPPYELGFMGKGWDATGIANNPALWSEVLRVLKPGGHLASFGGTRTYHRMACAIEDAGFEVRDQLAWVYGQGFPKSLDVSKAIDKAAGAEREVVGIADRKASLGSSGIYGDSVESTRPTITAPATNAARQWDGWGTALKPAWEPICLARKPLSERTIAANVLKHGVGAININGCRINALNDENEPSTRPKEIARRQCSVHGMRVLQEDDARLEVQGEKGEASDQLQRSVPSELDARGEKPALCQERMVRDTHWLSEVESRQASPIGYRSSAYPDSSGLSGTPNGDGATLRTGVASGGERPPHQWGQAGQPVGQLGSDRLDLSRQGAHEDRAHDDKASQREREAATCTCGGKGGLTARFPANLCHDGSDEVLDLFPESKSGIAVTRNGGGRLIGGNGIYGGSQPHDGVPDSGYTDSGSAARFFYCAKARKGDRAGSKHPTVKPVKLMQWLCRLLTPPGGVILDPFAGSGTTGAAAILEGFRPILIEREDEYVADIRRRLAT